jgi:hypothetical protein
MSHYAIAISLAFVVLLMVLLSPTFYALFVNDHPVLLCQPVAITVDEFPPTDRPGWNWECHAMPSRGR